MHWVTHTPAETIELGKKLGAQLPLGTILLLQGDLGAGKTTLIKGIVAGFGHLLPDEVVSPTFTYLNVYEGAQGQLLYHFDLYRLEGVEMFIHLGFEEYLGGSGVCCIEWSEKIAPLLAHYRCTTLALEHRAEGLRNISWMADEIH